MNRYQFNPPGRSFGPHEPSRNLGTANSCMTLRRTEADMYRGALSRDLPAFRGKPCPIPNLKPVK